MVAVRESGLSSLPQLQIICVGALSTRKMSPLVSRGVSSFTGRCCFATFPWALQKKKKGQQAFGGEAREYLAHDDDTWKKKDFSQDDHDPVSLHFSGFPRRFWTLLSPNCLLPVSSNCSRPRVPLSRESSAT